jgi:hypothetical protein
MKASLDKFILSFPVLFLKQYPYAWIAVVVLWAWPPNISIIFLAVILIGIASLHWRAAAWVADMRRQYAPGGQPFLVQRVPIPWAEAPRKIIILLAAAGITSWLASELVGLSFLQFFLMIVGFALTYMDGRFFGPQTIYVVTDTSIAIYYVPGHLDYRIIVRFKEIGKAQKLEHIEKIEETWTVCSRVRKPASGVLLVPRNPYGFSKQLQEILVTPTDVDAFLKLIPSTLTNEL